MRRLVGQHDIEGQIGESLEQDGVGAGAQDDLGPAIGQDGAQEGKLEIAREGGLRADAQGLARIAGLAQGGNQLVPCAEDAVGVIQRDAPGLGQD